MSSPKPLRQPPGGAMRFASAGVELAATVGVGCLAGYWIDRRFETSPWGFVVCSAVGVVGGLYNMIRPAIREMTSLSERERKGRRGESDGKGNP